MKIKSIAQKLGSLGGKARAKRLSPERRKEIASLGGKSKTFSLLAKKRIEANLSHVRFIKCLRRAYEKSVNTN
jgi:hypothetical protein